MLHIGRKEPCLRNILPVERMLDKQKNEYECRNFPALYTVFESIQNPICILFSLSYISLFHDKELLLMISNATHITGDSYSYFAFSAKSFFPNE